MVIEASKDKKHLVFARRLNDFLDAVGYPLKGKNRQGMVGKRYGVSQKGARKWLEGEGLPSDEVIAKMAKDFGVTRGQVRYGDESDGNIRPQPYAKGLIPVIPIGKAGLPLNEYDPSKENEIEEWAPPCPDKHSPFTYCVRVDGNSMTSDKAPSFPHGCLIYCDPEQKDRASVGDQVIALLDDSEIPVFSDLDKEGDKYILKPRNSQYPILRGEFEVLAKVIGIYTSLT